MRNRISPWPCRVLLVDENDAFLDGLTDWFDGAPEIQIIGRAHTRVEALQRISALTPDVILIDMRLPDGNGFDIVRSIKTNSAHSLVVMMSFHDSDHIRTTARSSGADGCISKADVPENLASCIETLIANRDSGSTTDSVSGRRRQSGR